jgi:hypothetical protein
VFCIESVIVSMREQRATAKDCVCASIDSPSWTIEGIVGMLHGCCLYVTAAWLLSSCHCQICGRLVTESTLH